METIADAPAPLKVTLGNKIIMNSTRILIVVILSGFVVVGCGPKKHWVDLGWAKNHLETDKYNCEREAESRVFSEESQRNQRSPMLCSGYVNGVYTTYYCQRSSGYSSGTHAFFAGMNKSLTRDRYYKECMRGYGWGQEAVQKKSTYNWGVPGPHCNEKEEWGAANKADTVEAYKKYIKVCNPAENITEAINKIKELE